MGRLRLLISSLLSFERDEPSRLLAGCYRRVMNQAPRATSPTSTRPATAIVAVGPPTEIIANGARSYTARYLREFLTNGRQERWTVGS